MEVQETTLTPDQRHDIAMAVTVHLRWIGEVAAEFGVSPHEAQDALLEELARERRVAEARGYRRGRGFWIPPLARPRVRTAAA